MSTHVRSSIYKLGWETLSFWYCCSALPNPMLNSLPTIVKPIFSVHSKLDKTKVLKTNGSLMKVESIAECSLGAFCNTFDLH